MASSTITQAASVLTTEVANQVVMGITAALPHVAALLGLVFLVKLALYFLAAGNADMEMARAMREIEDDT